jgi:hypothetical protein
MIDTGTMATAAVGSLPAQGFTISQALGLAYDPVRDAILILDRNGHNVYTMDPSTGLASVLFSPGPVFQGGAVLNDTLYGIDESAQRVIAFSLTTFANVLTAAVGCTGHSHGMGVDPASGEIYVRNGSAIYLVDLMGVPGATVVTTAGVEDCDPLSSGDFVGVDYSRQIDLIDGTTGGHMVLMDSAALSAVGVTGSMSGVAVRVNGSNMRILTIDTMPTAVGVGQTGILVGMDLENIGNDPLDILSADLVFLDPAMVDVSAEYTVTPAPGNPTSVAALSMAHLDFTVDVGTTPTLGTITLDGMVDAIEPVSMTPNPDAEADTTDAWDVLGAQPEVRTVDAPDATVSQGRSGYPVSVSIENTGLAELVVATIDFTFTGSADRTSEYTVNPAPSNPTSVLPGITEVFDFTVDVALAATTELVTIDAGVTGTTNPGAAPVADPGADVTDAWDVVPCTAPTCGDCSGDLVVTIVDALIAAQHSAALITLTGIDFSNCNVIGVLEPDPIAVVDIIDALTLAQFAAGLPVTLMCC